MSESQNKARKILVIGGLAAAPGETPKAAVSRLAESEPKHISQLDPTRRAIADQAVKDALLAIVVQQGKPVTIPLDVLNATSESHRLIIEVDRGQNIVTFRTERAETIIQG